MVTTDGLEVKDCPGTQGLKFWKVNSRKFFAVPEEDLLAPVVSDSAPTCNELVIPAKSSARGSSV